MLVGIKDMVARHPRLGRFWTDHGAVAPRGPEGAGRPHGQASPSLPEPVEVERREGRNRFRFGLGEPRLDRRPMALGGPRVGAANDGHARGISSLALAALRGNFSAGTRVRQPAAHAAVQPFGNGQRAHLNGADRCADGKFACFAPIKGASARHLLPLDQPACEIDASIDDIGQDSCRSRLRQRFLTVLHRTVRFRTRRRRSGAGYGPPVVARFHRVFRGRSDLRPAADHDDFGPSRAHPRARDLGPPPRAPHGRRRTEAGCGPSRAPATR